MTTSDSLCVELLSTDSDMLKQITGVKLIAGRKILAFLSEKQRHPPTEMPEVDYLERS